MGFRQRPDSRRADAVTSAPLLVLLCGDVPDAASGTRPVRLEVGRGTVRRVGPDGVTAWDVTGCRLHPTVGDSLGLTVPIAFVNGADDVRCWLDLAEWMPGALRSDPASPPPGIAAWAERVTAAVALAAGVRRGTTSVPTTGPRLHALDPDAARRRGYLQMAAAVATVLVLALGLQIAADAVLALGGALAVGLVVVAGAPRSWWPRSDVAVTWRIPLASPRGVRAGWVAGAELGETEGRAALVQLTADGVRRWLPVTGPTAPVCVSVSRSTNSAVLRTEGLAIDLSPRKASDVEALAEHLRRYGLRVEEAEYLTPPSLRPMIPSGAVGDARWSAGLAFAVLGGITALAAAAEGAGVLGVIPLAVAALLALAAAVSALLSAAALRRERS